MRIAPNHPRLRIAALVCFILGTWWLLQSVLFVVIFRHPLSLAAMIFVGAFLLAFALAFWLLGNDRRAGISFDTKGIMLNLGHYAAFVSWHNIAAVGVTGKRSSWLALDSGEQFGIRLRDPAAYLQSYETRLPASTGPLARALRLLDGLLRRVRRGTAEPTVRDLARLRERSGYDIVIPEALLGGRASTFCEILETYRRDYSRIGTHL